MKKIFEAPHGSYLYGTNTPESDKDFKGVFVNTDFSELILGRAPRHFQDSTGDDLSKNTNEDIDREYFELWRFLQDLAKGETVAIDMLHTPKEMATIWTPEWQVIYESRAAFYTTNMKAYLGYVRKQANKYGLKGSRMGCLEQVVTQVEGFEDNLHPERLRLSDMKTFLPTNEFCFFETKTLRNGTEQEFYQVLDSMYQLTAPLEDFIKGIRCKWDKYGERSRLAKNNEGIDWKAISHAFRAGLQLKEIYNTGDLIYPLKDREFLLQVKRGELDWTTELEPKLIDLIYEVEVLAEYSNLPSKVDMRPFEKWVVEVYESEFAAR